MRTGASAPAASDRRANGAGKTPPSEELEIGLQHPLLAQHLIGEVVHCFRKANPAISRVAKSGRPASWSWTAPSRSSQKAPVDRARQLHQRPIHVEHLIEPGPEQVGLAALSALPRSHCPRTPRFVRTMESQGAGRIKFAGIVVHSHEIRQTRILVQIQNSHKISGVRSPQTTRKRSRFRSRCPR